METLYSNWNPSEQYHLTNLSASSGHATCDTSPASNDSAVLNFFYSTPSINDHNHHFVHPHHYNINTNYCQNEVNYYSEQLPVTSINTINNVNHYSIPTSMESPANTSYSSPSPSPDLWDNYYQTSDIVKLTNFNNNQQSDLLNQQNYQQQQQLQHQQQQQQQQNQQQQQQQQVTLGETNTYNNTALSAPNINSTINNKNLVNPINKVLKESIPIKVANKSNTKKISLDSVKVEPNSSPNNNNNGNQETYHHHHHLYNNHRTSYHNHHYHHHHHHRSIEGRSGSDYKYLSPEDEERRRRRRERNKVAATKCRNKKKVHVIKLCQESKTLELTNSSLKEEMQTLKREEQRLHEILTKHEPFCCQRTPQPIQ